MRIKRIRFKGALGEYADMYRLRLKWGEWLAEKYGGHYQHTTPHFPAMYEFYYDS